MLYHVKLLYIFGQPNFQYAQLNFWGNRNLDVGRSWQKKLRCPFLINEGWNKTTVQYKHCLPILPGYMIFPCEPAMSPQDCWTNIWRRGRWLPWRWHSVSSLMGRPHSSLSSSSSHMERIQRWARAASISGQTEGRLLGRCQKMQRQETNKPSKCSL